MKLRKTFVALGAAAALTLTACGNAEDSADGGGDSSGSSGSSESAATATSAGLTEESFASSISDAQAKAESTHLQMSIESQGMEIEGAGDVAVDPKSKDPKDAKMALTLAMPQIGDIEMRLVDGMMYMKMGSMTQGKFVEFDLTKKKNNPFGTSLEDITSQADPNAMIDQLAGSLKDFEKTDETKEMDGVEATKYVLTINGKQIKNMMGSQSGNPGGMSSMDLPKEVKADVWIGEDDLVRKMTMDIDEGSMPMSMEMTFTDWGEPIVVEAPSKNDTIDSSAFENMTSM